MNALYNRTMIKTTSQDIFIEESKASGPGITWMQPEYYNRQMKPKEQVLPYPCWFYEALLLNILPRPKLTKRPPESLELNLGMPTNEPHLTPIVQKVSRAKVHDYSAVMREHFDIVVKLMLEHKVEGSKVAQLTSIQSSLLKAYLQYILVPCCIERIFSLKEPCIQIKTEDMLDLSKRRDETLKKVLSISLKLIYREYIHRHKINQSLNPRKYIKRSEVNRRIFKEYFDREPMLVKRRNKEAWEHNLLFFIKEGVTEEWFEAVLGVRHSFILHSAPCTTFLEKIYSTLRSDQLLHLYKRKIVSMVKKFFTVDDEYKPLPGSDSKLPDVCYSICLSKLEPCKKKPKTALTIEQFKSAVKVAVATLDRFKQKYKVTCDERNDTSGQTADHSDSSGLGFHMNYSSSNLENFDLDGSDASSDDF